MKRINFLFFLAFAFASPALACLNYYGVDEQERGHHGEFRSPAHFYFFRREEIKELKKIGKWIDESEAATRYQYISDYAAKLMELGRAVDALSILENLVQEKPDEYTIHANIAVAYELNGELDKALIHQKRAMELRPDGHYGSEWFHLQILEAAIKLRDQPTSLASIQVLSLPAFGPDTLLGHLRYQLHERIPLTPSSNPLLARVIEESADYYRKELSLVWAIDLYTIALGYSTDEATGKRLWDKIISARDRFVELRKLDKYLSDGEGLREPGWKKEVQKDADKWKRYSPYVYGGKIKLFQPYLQPDSTGCLIEIKGKAVVLQ